MKRRLIWTASWLAGGALAWFPMASLPLYFAVNHTFDRISPWRLPFVAPVYWWYYGDDPRVTYWLPICAAGAGLLAIIPAFCALFLWPSYSTRLRAARPGQEPPEPPRALSDVHGNADWMTMAEARRLFPGPHREYGGVVVGEAYRVDRDTVADVRFDPENPRTWGRGGTADMLIEADGAHGAVIAGTGAGKTTATVIPTLAVWTCSVVVFDPSSQVGPMTAAMREAMGHNVVMVGPGRDGFNALDWIDIRDPLAEAHVTNMVDLIVGETTTVERQGPNAIFRTRAKELLICLLADMLWDSKLKPEQRTIREFRRRIRTPEKKMQGWLADVAVESESKLARDLASTMMDVYHETFSGIYSNAVADTQWLSIDAYADMLSGDSFETRDLLGGKLTVFIQIPLDSLRATPPIGRVVVSALLNTVYRAEGNLKGRVLFLLDEVNFLGRLKALEDARDAGRKFGITLVMIWQNIGQLTQTWGHEGKTTWFNAFTWRQFAVVDDMATAEEISKTAGKYTVLARTQGASTNMQGALSRGARSRGTNQGLSEQSRDLIRSDEVRTRLRGDAAITFRRGEPPLLHGRAFYFRRAAMRQLIEADRYRNAAE